MQDATYCGCIAGCLVDEFTGSMCKSGAKLTLLKKHFCQMDRLRKWWILLGEEGIGPVKLKEWVEVVGSLDRAWEQAKSGDAFFPVKEAKRLQSLELTLTKQSHWAFSWEDKAYPARWRELRDAPVVAFGIGNQKAFNERAFVAVVGTRACTQRAANLGFEVGRKLAQQHWAIVSGLARGVDAMAHRGACYGGGVTVACLGGPLHRIYPREHQKLAEKIIMQNGALITEHANDAEVYPWHFAARNRLIVGLAQALVLIQSPLRGGALISAQLALDSGVDCWVYRPDNVKETGERWAGNRKILEEFPDMGWHSMEELLAHLGKPMKAVAPNQLETELTDELLPIWNCIIEKGGAQVSDIAQACQVPLAMTARRLFILELKGLVQRIPGGWYVPRNLG